MIVDAHAHVFPGGLSGAPAGAPDPRWPVLVVGDNTTGRIMCGETVFRVVSAPLWDVAARLAELDAAGVDRQIVSPVPVMLTYWAAAAAAASFTRELNDAVAAVVVEGDGRLVGLGAVALQDVGGAVDELRRIIGELGLRGVEIGTRIGERELDDPALRPFWAAAQKCGAAVFIHPTDGGGGAIRRSGQPYDFGLGMLTDTAMAAAALVFGGVLEEFPGLRVGLAHGCGTFPWAYPRLRLATRLTGEQQPERFDAVVRSLWADALVFDPAHLALLVDRFGSEHVILGTDYPFVPGQLEATQRMVRSAVGRGLEADAVDRILGANALAFVGLPATVSGRR